MSNTTKMPTDRNGNYYGGPATAKGAAEYLEMTIPGTYAEDEYGTPYDPTTEEIEKMVRQLKKHGYDAAAKKLATAKTLADLQKMAQEE